MKSPMMLLMERLLQTEPQDTPKPRRHKRGRSWMGQQRPMVKALERQLKRARETAARGNVEAVRRVERLERALLAVNGKPTSE